MALHYRIQLTPGPRRPTRDGTRQDLRTPNDMCIRRRRTDSTRGRARKACQYTREGDAVAGQ